MLQSNVNMIEFFPKNGKAIFYTLTATGLVLIIIAFIALVYTPQVRGRRVGKKIQNFEEIHGWMD